MKHAKLQYRFAVLALCLFNVTGVAAAAELNYWNFLPTRVLDIEGGSVSFQSAVIVDTRGQLANPALQSYPTKYILSVTNESASPIWVKAEWRVPGEKPFPSSGKLSVNEFGVFFVKIKKVLWNTPIPIKVTIYADEKNTRKLGDRDISLLFREEPEEKAAFLESAKRVNTVMEKMAFAQGKAPWIPVLPGFQEMVDMSKPVPGTAADEKLTEDIRLLLWKNQSRSYWDCEHEVLGAHIIDPADTEQFETLGEDDKQRINEGRTRGDISFEEWRVKSCNSIASYLVLMGRDVENGGTDVMAVKISDTASP